MQCAGKEKRRKTVKEAGSMQGKTVTSLYWAVCSEKQDSKHKQKQNDKKRAAKN
jgi:hypothetical protein